MCIGIPMRVLRVDGAIAHCEAWGQERRVGLLRLLGDEPAVGEYVVVHAGQAIERISAERALEAQALYVQMLDQDPHQSGPPPSAHDGTALDGTAHGG
jgi:hydrogenase expression/formation protein HypC